VNCAGANSNRKALRKEGLHLSETAALPDLRNRLMHALDAIADPADVSFYVLVDCALHDPLAGMPERENAIVVPIRHPDVAQARRPYLLPLGEFGRDRRIDETLQLAYDQARRHASQSAHGRSICGWLAARGSPDTVAWQLAKASHQMIEGRSRLFRYWDPRVLDVLSGLLDTAQAQALFRPVCGWWWLNRNAALQCALLQTAGRDTSEVPAAFTLAPAQIERLRQVESVNRCLDVWQDLQHNPEADGVRDRIARLIAVGTRKWDLQTDRDQVSYAMYGLLVHEGFDEDAEVRRVMQAARAAGTSPIEALSHFDEAYWDRLKHRLAQAPSVLLKEERHHG
jgi:hypothetical protein